MAETSVPQFFATPQFALIADTVRLEVTQFMALVAKRLAIAHVVSELREQRQWLFVVGTKIATTIIAAIEAGKLIAGKNGQSPRAVLRSAPKVFVALTRAVLESVMSRTPRRSFSGDRTDFRSRLRGVLFPEPIGRPPLCGFAHLAPTLGAHFGALHHG